MGCMLRSWVEINDKLCAESLDVRCHYQQLGVQGKMTWKWTLWKCVKCGLDWCMSQ
jgi:hypothetical protein